jgi:hypothetical protein
MVTRLVRASLVFGIGLALAFVRLPPVRRSRAPAVWACDRGQQEIVVLDAELFVLRRFELAAPTLIELDGDRLWALSAYEGTPWGKHRLHLLDALSGESLRQVELQRVSALVVAADRRALVLEHALDETQRSWLTWVAADGVAVRSSAVADWTALAVNAGTVLAGSSAGALFTIVRGRAAEFVAQLDAPIAALAGARGGGWWALADDGRLFSLDAAYVVRWSTWQRPEIARLAPTEHGLLSFSLEGSRCALFHPEEKRPARRIDVLMGGLEAALAWGDGGLLIAAPGALLNVGPGNSLGPGQGGFGYLTDLAGR